VDPLDGAAVAAGLQAAKSIEATITKETIQYKDFVRIFFSFAKDKKIS
jgi:hypothetical protein